MHRILAIIERDLRRFRRSPTLIVVSMVMPLVQLVVLGYAFGGKVKHLTVGVVDQDHGSRNLTNTTYRFRYDQATKRFILIGFDYADADRLTAHLVSESTNYSTGVRITTREKGERDLKKQSIVPKKKTPLEDVDAAKMEQDAEKRLGLG